jgi:hypothetical protein
VYCLAADDDTCVPADLLLSLRGAVLAIEYR